MTLLGSPRRRRTRAPLEQPLHGLHLRISARLPQAGMAEGAPHAGDVLGQNDRQKRERERWIFADAGQLLLDERERSVEPHRKLLARRQVLPVQLRELI